MEVKFFKKTPYSDSMDIGRTMDVKELDLSMIKVWFADTELDESNHECIAQMEGCTSWVRAHKGFVCVEFLEGFFDKKRT